MSGCYYCDNHANPFKYGYAPLWFAWRPVNTSNGVVWLKRVHRIAQVAPSQSLFGVERTEIWNEYAKCTKEEVE